MKVRTCKKRPTNEYVQHEDDREAKEDDQHEVKREASGFKVVVEWIISTALR